MIIGSFFSNPKDIEFQHWIQRRKYLNNFEELSEVTENETILFE